MPWMIGFGPLDPQDVGPVGAGEGMVALDAALAGLGIGRKFCRQLRAELRLEDVTRQGRCGEGCVILLIDMDDLEVRL